MSAAITPFFQYVRRIMLLTALLAIISYLLNLLLPAAWITPAIYYLLLFFFSVQIVVHYVLLKAVSKRFNRFMQYYMAATFLKLFFFISVIVVYILLHRQDALPFAVAFFIYYLIFTTFEVVMLIREPHQKT
ncbi:MAG TPA: hypothetical protein P5531_09735 [Bacteroidales bacterium]|nr:hypothetical protein [Bacteroidales bacterium]HSA43917.1 hypothetical protein [Bacteroidales bacterium]